MTTLIAKVKNGRIDVPAFPEFPDGSEVEVSLRLAPDAPPAVVNDPYSIDNWLAGAGSDEPPLITNSITGILRDEDYPTDPKSIERWVAELDENHSDPESEQAYLEIERIMRENRERQREMMAERERQQERSQS